MSQISSNQSTPPGGTSSIVPLAASFQIVTLTPEQSEAKFVELRDSQEKTIGFLFHESGMSIYYTPEQLAGLQRQAENPVPGRSLREVLESLQQRAQG